jgi:valyl-tRNA synthetase
VDPPPALVAALDAESEGLTMLARLENLETVTASPEGEPGAHAVLRTGGEIFLPLRDVIDLDREKQRLVAELDRLSSLLASARGKLENSGFLERAPVEVVEREREKATSLEQRYERLLEKKAAFGLD